MMGHDFADAQWKAKHTIPFVCPECDWKNRDAGQFCPVCWNCLNCVRVYGHDKQVHEGKK